MRRVAVVAPIALALCACELQEVTLADADPFVVAESYLAAGGWPRVALHASAGADELLDEPATIQLLAADTAITLMLTDPLECLTNGYSINPRDFPGGFACYQEPLSTAPGAELYVIEAGALYQLTVELPGGSRLDGATRVPAQVELATDVGTADQPCYLEPWTQLELTWNSTAGTAAYILDMRVSGLRDALETEGIVAEIPEPLILRGLAIGDSDTTIVLPREFGLFDRFSLDAELTLALQQGLPAGVTFDVLIAAADQNFVDWVRGGDFNPSGLIRTPSLFGNAGTGVVASMTVDDLHGTTYWFEHEGHTPPPDC